MIKARYQIIKDRLGGVGRQRRPASNQLPRACRLSRWRGALATLCHPSEIRLHRGNATFDARLAEEIVASYEGRVLAAPSVSAASRKAYLAEPSIVDAWGLPGALSPGQRLEIIQAVDSGRLRMCVNRQPAKRSDIQKLTSHAAGERFANTHTFEEKGLATLSLGHPLYQAKALFEAGVARRKNAAEKAVAIRDEGKPEDMSHAAKSWRRAKASDTSFHAWAVSYSGQMGGSPAKSTLYGWRIKKNWP